MENFKVLTEEVNRVVLQCNTDMQNRITEMEEVQEVKIHKELTKLLSKASSRPNMNSTDKRLKKESIKMNFLLSEGHIGLHDLEVD